MKPAYENDKKAILSRLNRIEGQVRGVGRMVGEDSYCIDILTQIGAIKAAIDQVAMLLLEDHVRGCVTDSVRAGKTDKVDELVGAVKRFTRA